MNDRQRLEAIVSIINKYLPPDGIHINEAMSEIISLVDPLPPQQEALYGMNQDDWKDVVAAIAKVRDGRGIYLACRPADVFQEWFLALGTAKVKEKNGWTRRFKDGIQWWMDTTRPMSEALFPNPPQWHIDTGNLVRLVPQREWVGLTDEELKHIEETTTCLENESWLRNLARNLEAKLKEKNG